MYFNNNRKQQQQQEQKTWNLKNKEKYLCLEVLDFFYSFPELVSKIATHLLYYIEKWSVRKSSYVNKVNLLINETWTWKSDKMSFCDRQYWTVETENLMPLFLTRFSLVFDKLHIGEITLPTELISIY